VPIRDMNEKNKLTKENDINNLIRDANALLLNVNDKALFDSMVYHIKQIAPTLAVRS